MAYTITQTCGALKVNGKPCQNPIKVGTKTCKAGHVPANAGVHGTQAPAGAFAASTPSIDVEEWLSGAGFEADDLYAGAFEEEEEDVQPAPAPVATHTSLQIFSANIANCVIARLERCAAMNEALEVGAPTIAPAACESATQYDNRVSLTDGRVMEARTTVLDWVDTTGNLSTVQKRFIRERTEQFTEEFSNVVWAHNTSIKMMDYGAPGSLGDSAITALPKLRNGLKSEQHFVTMREEYLRSYRDELHRFCAPLGVRVGHEEWFKPANAAVASVYSAQTFLAQAVQQLGG